MTFSSADQERIKAALAEKAKVDTCPMCRHNEWTLVDLGQVSLSVQEQPGTFTLGGKTLPNVALICTTCGYTLLFNLIVLGLRDLIEPESDTAGAGTSKIETANG